MGVDHEAQDTYLEIQVLFCLFHGDDYCYLFFSSIG